MCQLNTVYELKADKVATNGKAGGYLRIMKIKNRRVAYQCFSCDGAPVGSGSRDQDQVEKWIKCAVTPDEWYKIWAEQEKRSLTGKISADILLA